MPNNTERPQIRRRSPASAIFVHLLDRYVNDAPNKTRLDQVIATALDVTPGARDLLKPSIDRWRAIPLEQRREIYGDEFSDLTAIARMPSDTIEAELRKSMEKPLLNIAPGIRGKPLPNFAGRTEAPPAFGWEPMPVNAAQIPQVAGLDIPALTSELSNVVSTMSPALYKIDFAGIYCIKETSWDQSSDSDEPYVLFTMTDGFNEPWSQSSMVYDDMDSDDDWGPLPALLSLYGQDGPAQPKEISITAVVMEHDFGDPDALKEKVRLGVKAAQSLAQIYGIPVPDAVVNFATEIINDLLGTGDDFLGISSFVVEPGGFVYYAQQPLAHFKVQIDYHLVSYHTDGDAEYQVFYRVKQTEPNVQDPPSSAQGKFNGIWTPSTTPQYVAWGSTRDKIIEQYGDMWKINMRLIDLQAYVANGQVFYNGVWNPGNHGQLLILDWQLKDFHAKYDEMWKKNFRLIRQQAIVVNGQVLYNGIWNPGNHAQFVSWGKTITQIKAQYDEMWKKNMRLIDLQAYVKDGQVLYNGVWNPGNHGQLVVWDWQLKDFHAKYGEMWKKNFRLIQQQAFVINGQVLHLGVWNPSNNAQFVRWNTSLNHFSALYGEVWKKNFRLLDMDVY